MELNHEELRAKFVNFDGQKTLSVIRNNFKKGESNPWPEVFEEFSGQIKQNIGVENHGALVPTFSVTTPLASIVH